MKLFPALLALTLAAAATAASAGEPPVPELMNRAQPEPNLVIGGQPKPMDLAHAAQAGIEVVVNLRGESEAVDFDQAGLIKALGMRYVQLPISGADDLSRDNVAAFGEILEDLGDRPVLMHCASGNRVGALFALHAGLFEGKDTEAAIEYGRERGLGNLDEEVRRRLEEAGR